MNDTLELAGHITSVCGEMEHVRLMEVCGTHTVNIFRAGLKSMFPDNLSLISGPGCPVCVTSQGYIDAACGLAGTGDAVITTYGDMMRVPGQNGSLAEIRADGADVRVVYSARDALKIAAENRDLEIVFLAVGFETTAPTVAATIVEAEAAGIDNFSVMAAHKFIIPAMTSLLEGNGVQIDGFLCPGHVSVIIGTNAYRQIAEKYSKPCVVAGFEPEGILEAVLRLCQLVKNGKPAVENAYPAAVNPAGNTTAQDIIAKVFKPGPATWRAMGTIPDSGTIFRDNYFVFDAFAKFKIEEGADYCPPGCRCGEVIQGRISPGECGLFGKTCTPENPVGPCMVSSEGTCAAWFKYK